MKFESRRRVEKIINFETPDRVAFNFWMDRKRMAEFDQKYGNNFRISHYDADIVESFAMIEYPQGQFEHGANSSWLAEPLFTSFADADTIKLPDPHNSNIYATIKEDISKYPDKAVIVDLPNVLTISEAMCPQTQLYMEMITAADDVKRLFNRLSDIMAAVAEQVCKMDITALYVMDDCACNKGLLMSPAMLREFVVPNWKKVIDVAHAHNKPVFFHSDGNLQEIFGLFADELKVRMLNPLQPNLQDVESFKKTYYGKTGIYGGIDTGTLHEKKPEEIKKHVRELFEKAGGGGGLIISTHDIDYSITDEQLDAFVSAIKSCAY